MELWQEKYRPQTIDDYLDLEKYMPAIQKWWQPFDTFYKNTIAYKTQLLKKPAATKRKSGVDSKSKKTKQPILSQPPEKITPAPFLILYGEPGTGKTTLAHCIFKMFDSDVIEINSSDARSKRMLSEIIDTGKKSVVYSGDGNKEIGIIMDELDGLSTGDMGGASTLVEMTILNKLDSGLMHVRYPVICTTNSIKEKKLKPILDLGILVNITQPGPETLLKLATKINSQEGICLTDQQLKALCNSCPGDFRKLIEHLYTISFALKSPEIKSMPSALDNIIAGLAGNKSQLAQFTNMGIQDLLSNIIQCKPGPGFNNELELLIDSDSQIFLLNLLDNYISITQQIINSSTNCKSNTICPGNCQQLETKTIDQAARDFIQIISSISSNYRNIEKYISWTNIYKDWTLQDYINYISIFANITKLNKTLNNTVHHSKSSTNIKINYHSKYNGMKSDTGYFNNNIINFDVNIQPNNPGTTSKQPRYNFYGQILTGDPELLLMNKTAGYNIVEELQPATIGTIKHTANIIKKIKSSLESVSV